MAGKEKHKRQIKRRSCWGAAAQEQLQPRDAYMIFMEGTG